MLVTFVAAASVSFLNWPCHQNEHLKIFFKKYKCKKITNTRSCAQEISTEVYIFSIHDKNYTF